MISNRLAYFKFMHTILKHAHNYCTYRKCSLLEREVGLPCQADVADGILDDILVCLSWRFDVALWASVLCQSAV